MSDRVALDRQNTCDECMCDRNAHELFLNRMQAHLAPEPPVFELRRMCECSRKHVSLSITHNNRGLDSARDIPTEG